MASAVDSGVDTGNSNDSSVQEKLSKMDFENIHFKSTTAAVRNVGNEDQSYPQPHSSSAMVKVQTNTSVSEIDFRPMHLHMHMLQAKVSWYERDHPVGLFGSDYQENDLVRKIDRSRHSALKLRCRRRHMPSNAFGLINMRHATPSLYNDAVKMCRAVCHNNTDTVREMLAAGKSPNCHDTFKRTPLHLAACMGYGDMVELLLEHGADPNAKDSNGNTPLHLSVCTNHVRVTSLLLRAGTRVSERDTAGHSPLQLAITKLNIMRRSVRPDPVLREQITQVIKMMTEYMRRKEYIDPDLLNKFESLMRVRDSSEEVESNIKDLLSNLSLSSSS